MQAVFLWMHSAFPWREALEDTARQNGCGSLRNVKKNTSLSLNVYKMKTHTHTPKKKRTITKDARSYCFPSIFTLYFVYTEVNMGMKTERFLSFLGTLVVTDNWPFLPWDSLKHLVLKDSEIVEKKSGIFTAQEVCLLSKILFTPNLSGIYW